MSEDENRLPERLKRALKAGPEMRPSEAFYQAVLRRIASEPGGVGESAPSLKLRGADALGRRARWGIPIATLATACVLMVVIVTNREKLFRQEPAPAEEVLGGGSGEDRPWAAASKPPSGAAKRAQGEIVLEQEITDKVSEVLRRKPPETGRADGKPDSPLAAPMDPTEGSFAAARVPNVMKGRRAVSAQRLTARPDAPAVSNAGAASSEGPAPQRLDDQWIGQASAQRTPRQIVIRDAGAWKALWQAHAPGSPAPEVDFDRQMIVGVFLGERPNMGHEVRIADVKTLQDQLAVEYQELLPVEGQLYAAATAQPYALKAIPKTGLHIHFQPLRPLDR